MNWIEFNFLFKRKALRLNVINYYETRVVAKAELFIALFTVCVCVGVFIYSSFCLPTHLLISLKLTLSLPFILSLIWYSMQHNVKTDTKVSENLIKLCKKDQKIIISYPLLITHTRTYTHSTKMLVWNLFLLIQYQF